MSVRSVLFLADQFADSRRTASERHPGGAELTDAVAIAACPWPIATLSVGEWSRSALADHDLIVIGNASRASRELVAELSRLRRHVLFEHDVRICRWRGNFPSAIEPLHRLRQVCICPHKALKPLFASALGAIFLTERQRRVYERNPFFVASPHGVVGCSLFPRQLFERRSALHPDVRRSGTAVFASKNRIKGYQEAVSYCRQLAVVPEVIRDFSPEQVLDKFTRAERFVYLPVGLEPAGRMPVEARLLGCEVVVNGNVGVEGEPFWHASAEDALAFLEQGPARFWQLVEALVERRPVATPTPRATAPDEVRHYAAW